MRVSAPYSGDAVGLRSGHGYCPIELQVFPSGTKRKNFTQPVVHNLRPRHTGFLLFSTSVCVFFQNTWHSTARN